MGANGYEYVDRAICYGVAYEKDDPYTERDTNQCSRTIDRFDAGIKGYTYVPGNVDDVRRALSHNGGYGHWLKKRDKGGSTVIRFFISVSLC